MPIYEYACEACGYITSQLLLQQSEAPVPACRSCTSRQTRRVMSRFALHRSEAHRLAAYDPSGPHDANFYQDSRNVGLWAKKRAQERGVDLGPQFEETVEKARTGKILDDI